jgi:DNA-binding transcriptional regulator YhcF (GntR family)
VVRNVVIRVEGEVGRSVETAESWLAERLILDFYTGRIEVGDRLPSVRQLSGTLGVSTKTAFRIYRQLEARGFVESRHGSGTFVRPIGVHLEHSHRQATVLKLLQLVVRRTRLLGFSPGEFATLLLQRCGAALRSRFCFGVVSTGELFEAFAHQLETVLGFPLPLQHISPDIGRASRSTAARLLHDSSTRHLLATYLYWPTAFDLARDHHLPSLVLQLSPRYLDTLRPDRGSCRYIVTRDPDLATDVKRLIRATHGQQAADAIMAVDINNQRGLAHLGRSATEIVASPLCLQRVTAMFGRTHNIRPLPVELSEQTIDDIVYHYLFPQLGGEIPAGRSRSHETG